MRVLLIKPPIRAFMHEIGRHTPIGLAYLSSVLRRAGHEPVIFDGLAFTEDNAIIGDEELTPTDRRKLAHHPRWRYLLRWGASASRIADVLERVRPDVVGISCMFSPYYETAYEVARQARRLVPDATILIGGQHATVAPAHALSVPEIDLAVLGEAEETLPAILDALGSGAPLDAVEGVAFRCGEGRCRCDAADGSRLHVQRRQSWIEDLDALPFPDSGQLDFRRYNDATTLITSRGCPFSCTFCTVHATVGRRFRARSPKNVVDEIERYVSQTGVRTFLIEDDNFTFDMARVRRICEEIIARGLEVDLHLPNGITVLKLSPELVDLLARAGFRRLFLGLEATDPARLRAIAKSFTSLDKVQQASAWFANADIDVSASLIVGLPNQEAEEVAQDVANLLRAGLRFWSNPFYPIPGSPDFDRCLGAGIIDGGTDLALFDQYNFAIGSDRLSAADVYWLWVAVQAVAQWPTFMRDAPVDAPGDWSGVEPALSELMAATAAAPPKVLEVPAAVQEFRAVRDGVEVRLQTGSCFCTQHRLQRSATAAPVTGLCALSGDAIAAAVSLHSGCSVAAEEIACRLDGAEQCTFLLRAAPPRAVDVAIRRAIQADAAAAVGHVVAPALP